MQLRYSVLVWQSFIRTSHLLSSKLAGVVLDKPFAVVHTGRDYLGQALAWWNPARTNQFLETLNWRGIWYRLRTTTFYSWSQPVVYMKYECGTVTEPRPCSEGGISQFLLLDQCPKWAQCLMSDNDLTLNLLWRQKEKSLSEVQSRMQRFLYPNSW